MRVLILENIPTPYSALAFEALARRVSLSVVFCAATEGDRRWTIDHGRGYRVEVLPGRQLRYRRRWDTLSFHFNTSVRKVLLAQAWDVLVNSGWQQPANWLAYRLSHELGRPHVLWAGSTVHEDSLLRRLSLPLVRRIVRGSAGYISYGTAAKEYLAQLGADPDRIVPAYPNIDDASFAERLAGAQDAVVDLRRKLDLGDAPIVLYVGRLVGTKGVGDLIDAMASVGARHPQARLLIAGDGRERAALEHEAEQRIPGRYRFVGHVEHDALASYYAAATCFVLPSLNEVWGLVINAAALAGLPVVATSTCGASRDLIRDGETGHVVPPANPAALASALEQLLDDPVRARKMGAAGRELVSRIANPESVADAITRAAERARDAS
jgi:glycosyltransferase involved in cell wall biosynthesis